MSSKQRLFKCEFSNPQYRAFKIWLGLLGYKIKAMKGNGFYFKYGKDEGYITDNYLFNRRAYHLMQEFLSYD